jgi:hypothetical protein
VRWCMNRIPRHIFEFSTEGEWDERGMWHAWGRKLAVFWLINWGRQRGISRRRWGCYMKINLREIGWEDVDWTHLPQNRDKWRAPVNTVMNLRVLWNIRNLLTRWETVSFSRGTLFREISLIISYSNFDAHDGHEIQARFVSKNLEGQS